MFLRLFSRSWKTKLCSQFELRVRVIVSFESIIYTVSHGRLTLTNLTKLQISWILLPTLNYKMGFSSFTYLFEFSHFDIVIMLLVPLNTNVSPLCQVKPASGSCRYSLTIDYHHVLPPHQLLLPKLSSTWTYPRKSRENIWDVFNRSKRLSLLIQPPDLMQGQGFSNFGKDQ